MSLLAENITHGQALSLVLLCAFLIVFIVVDVYLVLSLRRKNKKLAKDAQLTKETDSDKQDKTNEKNKVDYE